MGAAMRFQPQGLLRINKSNPLARGLVVVVHPMSPGVNLVDGTPFVDPYGQGSSWTPTTNRGGRGLTNSASISYRITSASSWGAPTGATTAVVAIPRVLSPAQNRLVEFQASGWNAGSIFFGDGTNPRFCAGNNGSGMQFTTALADYVVGTTYTVVATTTTSAQMLAINGAVVAQTAYSPGALGAGHQFALYSPSSTAKVVEINLALAWNRPLTADEAVSVSQNPWQLFDAGSSSSAYQSAIATPSGAASPSGRTGTENSTLGSVTLSASGSAATSGAASITLGALIGAAAGASTESGVLASILGAATLNAIGTVSAAGTLNATMASATMSATGASPAGGTFASVLGPATLTAAASAPVDGGASKTLGGLSLAAAGTVSGAPDSQAAAASGELSSKLGGIAMSATGSAPAAGSAGIILGGLMASAAGSVADVGRADIALGTLSLSVYGGVPATGGMQGALGDLTMAATASMFAFTRSQARTYRIAPENRRYKIAAENRTYRIEP